MAAAIQLSLDTIKFFGADDAVVTFIFRNGDAELFKLSLPLDCGISLEKAVAKAARELADLMPAFVELTEKFAIAAAG